MTASDRTVPVHRFKGKTTDEMEAALKAQPLFADDTPWTYEVEADGLDFYQNGVLVERWRS